MEQRLIDANVLKEEVNKKRVVGRFNMLNLIDNAPTVEPEKAKEGELVKAYTKGFDTGVETVRPQGKWVVDEDIIFGAKKCSNCNKGAEWLDGGGQFLSKFCPNCGADMRGQNG